MEYGTVEKSGVLKAIAESHQLILKCTSAWYTVKTPLIAYTTFGITPLSGYEIVPPSPYPSKNYQI